MFEHIPKILICLICFICLICLICFPIDVALQRCLGISRGHNDGTSNSLVMFRYTEVGLLRIAIWTERFPDIPRVKSRELAVVSWSLLLLQQERGIWVKQSDFSGETHPPPQALRHFWKQMVTSSNPARFLSNLYSAYPTPIKLASYCHAHMKVSFRSPPLGPQIWDHHLVIETCRRCIRRTWGGGAEFLLRHIEKRSLLPAVVAGVRGCRCSPVKGST